MKLYNFWRGLIADCTKYGGSSVADKAAVQNAASRIAESFREGNKVVVVVSAQGNTTDELLKYASDMNPEASERELDMILSTGEQLSAALMAITLNAMNIPAISLNAWQLGDCYDGKLRKC